MIIIEIYNILLLLILKPSNSLPLIFLAYIGNEKWVTLAQFNIVSIPLIISYRIYHNDICMVYVI